MCRRATCEKCGRPTFAGCGMHIEQVVGDVPPAERCQCRAQKSAAAETDSRAPKKHWWSF